MIKQLNLNLNNKINAIRTLDTFMKNKIKTKHKKIKAKKLKESEKKKESKIFKKKI